MTLLASVLTGTAAALAVGAAAGNLPRIRWRTRPETDRRQEWLVQAGSDLSWRRFVLGSVGVGSATFVLLAHLTGTLAVAVVPAVVAGMLPRAYLSRRRVSRLREVQESWPEGIRELTAAIGAGLSMHQALETLATSGPEPLRHAFGRYPLLARVLGVVPALEVVREDLADPSSDRVIEVLILAHERGGPIVADILGDLADATSRDVRALEEMDTEGLEQRINARAVFVLPWFVLLVLTAQPGHFRAFYGTVGGLLVVIAGAAMCVLGSWWVARLAREPEEPRVLTRPSEQGATS